MEAPYEPLSYQFYRTISLTERFSGGEIVKNVERLKHSRAKRSEVSFVGLLAAGAGFLIPLLVMRQMIVSVKILVALATVEVIICIVALVFLWRYWRRTSAFETTIASLELLGRPSLFAKVEEQYADLKTDEGLVPAFYIKFYTLSVCTISVFATLFALNVLFGIETIHPFLSLIGILGGLSWLVPVVGDIRDWRHR